MMRLLHLADLHIGRRLHGYSLLEDQRQVLRQAARVVQDYRCDTVLLAGDIYDKPSPSIEALELFNSFLTELSAIGVPVYMISGNHDAAGRISYLADLIRQGGIYTVPKFGGRLQSYPVPDTDVTIHLMPFLRPTDVRRFYPELNIATYEDAVAAVLRYSLIDHNRVNVLVCHQFISGGSVCDSEEFAVGGLDNVSAALFDGFDYVALGHLHRPQSCTRPTMRYAGSPLKYSLSEEDHRKSFTVVTIDDEKSVSIETVDIALPHDVRTVRGAFAALMDMPYTEDYVRIVLTDELVPPDAAVSLRSVFPYMLQFRVENSRTKYDINVAATETIEKKSPAELLSDFFALQNNGVPPSEAQMQLAEALFTEIEEEMQ